MAKKNDTMLAKHLVIGDAIALNAEFNDFEVTNITDSDVASVDAQSVLEVRCTAGPFKNKTGRFMIRPDDTLTILRRGPRPTTWQKFKRLFKWSSRNKVANDNGEQPKHVVIASFGPK